MKGLLRGIFCVLTWVAMLFFGVLLWAVVDYYRGIPVVYWYYGAEAMEELQAKGLIWIVVQSVPFLLSAVLCFVTTRRVLKTRDYRKKKRETL